MTVIDFEKKKVISQLRINYKKSVEAIQKALPDKPCGYIGALIFLIARDNILKYLNCTKTTEKEFESLKKSIKADLWRFLNKLSNLEWRGENGDS